eukprot:jgi/Psemu1/41248/gm1.41248_g
MDSRSGGRNSSQVNLIQGKSKQGKQVFKARQCGMIPSFRRIERGTFFPNPRIKSDQIKSNQTNTKRINLIGRDPTQLQLNRRLGPPPVRFFAALATIGTRRGDAMQSNSKQFITASIRPPQGFGAAGFRTYRSNESPGQSRVLSWHCHCHVHIDIDIDIESLAFDAAIVRSLHFEPTRRAL